MMDNDSKKAENPPAADEQPAPGQATPETDGEVLLADALPDEAANDAGPVKEKLGELQAENDRLRDQLLRALAETENVRRRAEREKEDTAKFAVQRLARDLLNVADNLRRALEAVPAEVRGSALAEGVAATERELLSVFQRFDINRIDPLDQRFDPNFHQAMMEVPGTGKPAGTVVQVLASGYVLSGRLLRPALVAVAKGEPAPRVDTMA
jgi:molecular chaperone GrpE